MRIGYRFHLVHVEDESRGDAKTDQKEELGQLHAAKPDRDTVRGEFCFPK
jgi:hypothetical protein